MLNPGSISYNGQEIYSGRENYSALLVNNIPIEIKSVSGLETFYFTTDETSLRLEWQTLDGKTVPLINLQSQKVAEFKKGSDNLYYKIDERRFILQHPSLNEFKTDGNKLYFKFNEYVSSAHLDSKEISLQNPSLQIDHFKDWINEVHSLELTSPQNVDQIYNLDFRDMKSELLTTKNLSFSMGDGPFTGNTKPLAIGASIRILNEKNISYEGGVYLSNIYYEMDYGSSVNKITQSSCEFKGRAGYNPFDVNHGNFSYKRLTLGIQAEMIYYSRKSDHPTSFDGKMTDHFDLFYFQAGPFLRWEPIQFDKWGFFFNLDMRIVRTDSRVSSDSDIKSFGISYYY